MKNTFKKPAVRLLSVVLSVALLLSASVFAIPASAANPVYYSGLQSTYINGATQYYRYMTVGNGDAVVLPYQGWAGGSTATLDTIAAAEADGYTVYGGVNGEFFSMGGGNFGTLTGRLVSDGRIISDNEFNTNNCLILNSDGSFSMGASQINYNLYVDGVNKGAVIGYINKRSNNEVFDIVYYWDSACGTKSDSNIAGVELVCEKLYNTELTPEGVLQAKVVSRNTNTTASAIADNQFVLYAGKGTAYYSMLCGIKAGQEIQIYAQVANPDMREAFKNAYGITSATYPIVGGGKSIISQITSDPDGLITTRAQRTAIGFKADGSYVLLTGEGRNNDSSASCTGFTLHELAQVFIDMGCVDAVALDGGGSTQMVYNGERVDWNGRKVGSSILFVARNSMQGTPEWQRLNDMLYNAKTSTYPDAQQETVNKAIAQAEAVMADTTSAQKCDYQRAFQDLQTAMGLVTDVMPKTYLSLDAKTWAPDATAKAYNDANGNLLIENTDGRWPFTTTTVDISVPLDYVFEYDFTVAGATSFMLDGSDRTKLNMVFTSNVDSGSGDLGAGTYKGTISVSDMIDKIVAMSQFSQSKGLISAAVTRNDLINAKGEFSMSSLGICAVGTAGAGSRITLRTLTFRSPYSGGDIDGDGSINSTDARYVLRYLVGSKALNDAQIASADINKDGTVNTEDARYMLQKRVGLI